MLALLQVAEVTEGDLFRVETVDWTGGQIKDDDSAEDIKVVDLTQVCRPGWEGGYHSFTFVHVSKPKCKPLFWLGECVPGCIS